MIMARYQQLLARLEKLEAEVADLRKQAATKAAPKTGPKGGRPTGGPTTAVVPDED